MRNPNQSVLSVPLVLTALAAPLAAQDNASPYRFVPKDACVVARMSGPGVWRERFAGTQLAKLLHGPTLGPLLAELEQTVDAGLEELRKEGDVDVDALRKLLVEYSGELVFALQVDFAGIAAALENDERPPLAFVLALSPDGKSDFQGVAEALAKAAEERGDSRLRDLRVGDQLLRIGRTGDAADDVEVCVPTLVDGAFVFLAGTDLERSAPRLLGTDDRWEAPATADGSTFALHVAAEAGIGALLDALAAKGQQEQLPIDPKQLFTDFGLASLHSIDLTVGAAGKHVELALSVRFNEQERGLFGVLAAAKEQPRLLAFVPPAADAVSALHVDVGAVYRTIAKIWDGLPMVPMSREDAENAFAEQHKVRLREDLIDLVGNEVLLVQDAKAQFAAAQEAQEADDEAAALRAMFAGSAGAIALRDGKAFGDALEKVLRAHGLHAARKSEDYQGETVHRLRLLALAELEYCVAGDLLLLAGSDEAGRKELRAILDERAARKAGKTQTGFPAPVRERLAVLPGGWSGISTSSALNALHSMADGLESAVEHRGMPADVGGGLRQAVAVLRKVAADLPAFGLEHMVGTLHTDGDRWLSRSLW